MPEQAGRTLASNFVCYTVFIYMVGALYSRWRCAIGFFLIVILLVVFNGAAVHAAVRRLTDFIPLRYSGLKGG